MPHRRILLLTVALVSLAGVARSQDTAPSPAPGGADAAATQVHPALKDLTEEQRETLTTHLRKASEFVRGVRVSEAIAECDQAVKLAPDFYPSYNLLGACYTKLRDFKKARAQFAKAFELEPRAFDVNFNLAEMDFVEQAFDKAEPAFQKLVDNNPKLPKPTYDLLIYKIIVCKLMRKDLAAAKKLTDGFDYLDDTPAYYYSRAAVAFAEENRPEAFSWIRSAGGIFNNVQNQNYLDSLIEVGWVESIGSGTLPVNEGKEGGASGAAPVPPPVLVPAPGQ